MSQVVVTVVSMFEKEPAANAGNSWKDIYGPYVEMAHIAFRGLRSMPWSEMDPTQQLDLLGEVGPLRSELMALLAHGMHAVDQSGATVSEHGQTTNRWMSGETGDSKAETARQLKLGRTLEQFPLFQMALDDGQISIDHVMVLSNALNPRVRRIVQDSEAEFLKLATTCTVEQWRRDLRALIDLADMDGPTPKPPIREDEASVIFDETGRLTIHGEFFGPSAVTIFESFNAELNRRVRAAASERDELGVEMPAPKHLRGQTFVELLRRGAAAAPSKKAKTEAILILDPRSELHPITTLDGNDVDPVTAAILLADAHIHPLVLDDEGAPLNYGRSLRFISDEQFKSLAIRDGGCVFPGCDLPPSWCDGHHVVTWTKGEGPTDLNNLVLLCRKHHTRVHSDDWDLVHENSMDQAPTLIHTPSGKRRKIVNAQTRHLRRSSRSSGSSGSSSSTRPGRDSSASDDDDPSHFG